MREYDDYHEENIRLYTPVLQRVIILAAVIIAVPVMMWTITTFVRSYVARPKLPALEHVASTVASTNMPARIPTITLSPPSSAPSPPDQSAPQRIDEASVSDTSPTAETTSGGPNLASLPNASAPPTVANGPSGTSLQAMQTSSSAITATASTTGDISTTANAPLLRRRQDCPLRLDRVTMPPRSAPRVPPIAIAVLPGPIRIRPARQTSPHHGSRRPHLPRRRRVRRRPRSSRPMSPSAVRYLCHGSGPAFLPWLRPPPVRCRCPAPARRMLPRKRPIQSLSPPPAIGPGSTAIASAAHCNTAPLAMRTGS